jgi:hypothetical protein
VQIRVEHRSLFRRTGDIACCWMRNPLLSHYFRMAARNPVGCSMPEGREQNVPGIWNLVIRGRIQH